MLPLSGLRMLEFFCHAIMGPRAGLILADAEDIERMADPCHQYRGDRLLHENDREITDQRPKGDVTSFPSV
jgi:hypothetical protein